MDRHTFSHLCITSFQGVQRHWISVVEVAPSRKSPSHVKHPENLIYFGCTGLGDLALSCTSTHQSEFSNIWIQLWWHWCHGPSWFLLYVEGLSLCNMLYFSLPVFFCLHLCFSFVLQLLWWNVFSPYLSVHLFSSCVFCIPASVPAPSVSLICSSWLYGLSSVFVLMLSCMDSPCCLYAVYLFVTCLLMSNILDFWMSDVIIKTFVNCLCLYLCPFFMNCDNWGWWMFNNVKDLWR